MGGGELAQQARDRGIRVEPGRAVAKVKGGKRVTGVVVCLADGDGAEHAVIPCDAVAMSGGWSPVVHLWSHCGGKLTWNDDYAMFQPDPKRPPTGADGKGFVIPAGVAAGSQTDTDFEGLSLFETLRTGWKAGVEARGYAGGPPRLPLRPPSDEAREVIRAVVVREWIAANRSATVSGDPRVRGAGV